MVKRETCLGTSVWDGVLDDIEWACDSLVGLGPDLPGQLFTHYFLTDGIKESPE